MSGRIDTAKLGRRAALKGGGAALLGLATAHVTAAAKPGASGAERGSAVFDPNQVSYRRIITANDEQGRSYVWKDETLKRGEPLFVELWWTSPQEPLGINVHVPGEPKLVGGGNGGSGKMRMVYYTCMPTPKKTPEQERAEFVGVPVQSEYDTGILLNGELVMFLEKGEVIVHPGDVVVIRGARHFWRNYTQAPGVLFGTNTMI